MPSYPRCDVFREGEIGVYHCYNRCVRRAFLCGVDPVTGENYEHRRDRIVGFEQELARHFAVEVCFHAEMINHLHLVLRVRPDITATWSNEEVVRRWLTITHLVRSNDGKTIKPLSEKRIAKELANPEKVAKMRRKLASISNFMGSLCEHVARRSNAEDGVSGTFWEDRFKCQDLADEAAILCCGIYVDLNQIRAQEAQTPEDSQHTSAYERILAWRRREAAGTTDVKPGFPAGDDDAPDGWLCELTLASGPDASSSSGAPAASGRRASDQGLLPIGRQEYLELLDATGRMLRPDKPGVIPAELPPLLERLGKRGLSVNSSAWGNAVQNFSKCFGHIVGRGATLVEQAAARGRRWYRGRARCEEVFG